MNIVKRLSTPLAMVGTHIILEGIKEYSALEIYPAGESNRAQSLSCLRDILSELLFLVGAEENWNSYVSIQYSREHVYVVVDSEFDEKHRIMAKLEWLLSVLNMKVYKSEGRGVLGKDEKADIITDALMRYGHLPWDEITDTYGMTKIKAEEKKSVVFKILADTFFSQSAVIHIAIEVLEDILSQDIYGIAPNIKAGRLYKLLEELREEQAVQS